MGFLKADRISEAINRLAGVHPFHGITFLACKRAGMPVGRPWVFAMDSETNGFLKEFHRLDPASNYFFQPFRSSEKTKKWVVNDYSQKGLQAINTQTFRDAFIHESGSRQWSWAPNYLEALRRPSVLRQKIPLLDLAVWLYRDRALPESATTRSLVDLFKKDFKITADELNALFDHGGGRAIPLPLQRERVAWSDLRDEFPPPPDADPDRDGVLISLTTLNVGPAHRMLFEPGARLTLVTGDNGLGKTFLLDTLWWALSGTWASLPVFPTDRGKKASIAFSLKAERGAPETRDVQFNWRAVKWPDPKPGRTSPTLSVYSRVDGSFCVWDPQIDAVGGRGIGRLSGHELWNGAEGRTEGLIRDWVRWQTAADQSRFEAFSEVLKLLAPQDLGELEPGKPTRIPHDPRDIPTIRHPYAEIPIVFASAGVKRVLALAYLVVWAWHEHLAATEMAQSTPLRRMVVLIDEIEAHLHPRWQRSLLPAVLDLSHILSASLTGQFIVATHSPLVMASAESVFSPERDKLFHLHLQPSGEVGLLEQDFHRYGDVSNWLTSPAFELKQARASSAEAAIEAAKRLQLANKPSAEDVRAVTQQLQGTLGPEDRFWPRWIAFAEKYGVKI